jgi:hypothetical protein
MFPCTSEACQHLASEQRTKNADGEEKFRSSGDPAAAVEREPAAGGDAVHVRVEAKLPGPGVQHRRDTELRGRTQPLRIAAELEQRVGGGFHEQLEDDRAIAQRQGAQLRREREDDMKVVGRKDAPHARPDPARLREALALGTMPIATGIVRRTLVSAGGAHIEVATELCGAAAHERAHDGALVVAQGLAQQGAEVLACDIAELRRCACPARRAGMQGHDAACVSPSSGRAWCPANPRGS